MKMSRFKVAVLVLLAVTVIYPVALHLDIQRYEARNQSFLQSHPDAAPWIDFNPYGTTFTGALLISIAATLVICWVWVWVVAVKTHRKKLKSAMLMVLMFIVVLSFTPRAYAGYYEKTIDVLAVQDEEFRWLYPAGWQRDLGWGIYIDSAFGRFEEEFGITFRLRGWIDWESTDYAPDLYDLLQEAIEDTNFESHVTTYDGYVIDILMVFTGEPQDQSRGFSPPEWKALIIYALPDAPRGRLVQHELSHQFWVQHCNNDCVMNKAKWQFGQLVPDYWCGQCTTTINGNNDRFWRWIDDGGSGGAPGGGCPILSVFDGSNYVSEGLLDIHNPDGIDVIRNHTLTTTPQPINNAYLLRLTEHPQTHSHIDQVKLYAILDDGTETELPLTYAWHSEHGNVLPPLLFSDEWKTDTLGADLNNGTSQSIDLKFSALSPNLQAVSFIFQIEGNNRALKIP